MTGADRQDQDGRGRVEGIERRARPAHDAQSPSGGDQARHQGQNQALPGPEGLEMDQADDDEGKEEQRAYALGEHFHQAKEHGLARDIDSQRVRTIGGSDGVEAGRDGPEAVRVLAEIGYDGGCPPVVRQQQSPVYGVALQSGLERGPFLTGRGRGSQQRPDLQTIRRAAYVLDLAGTQAGEVRPDDARIASQGFRDASHGRQNLGARGIAFPWGDSQDHHEFVAKQPVGEIGRDEIGMRLRQCIVRVHDDGQTPQASHETGRDRQDQENRCPSPVNGERGDMSWQGGSACPSHAVFSSFRA